MIVPSIDLQGGHVEDAFGRLIEAVRGTSGDERDRVRTHLVDPVAHPKITEHLTEVGVIGTDLFGAHRPSIRPAPGLEVRERDGELWVSRPESPYVGLSDPTRWDDGWLHTRDAGVVDPDTGLVTIRGRLDSQVSVGGLKVDLTEVEQTIGALPGVAAAVVGFDDGITAWVQLSDAAAGPGLDDAIGELLASYKRPKVLHLLDQLPRTTTGKLVRDLSVLRGSTS